jgi:hypothetical protein
MGILEAEDPRIADIGLLMAGAKNLLTEEQTDVAH